MKFIKNREGSVVAFDLGRIVKAIEKSLIATNFGDALNIANEVAETVLENLKYQNFEDNIPTVENIQDQVESALMQHGYADTAKAYILYRNERKVIRDSKLNLNAQLKEIFDTSAQDSDLKRDNANINGNTAMGTMLQVGTAAAKSYYAKNYLTEEQSEANRAGAIHIHDFDFYGLTLTCCQIDLVRLFEGGFNTGHGFLREPAGIQSYSALACIAIQSNQNDHHGGQSVPNFDYALALGVKKTYRKEFQKAFCSALELTTGFDDGSKITKQILTDVEFDVGLMPELSENELFTKTLEEVLLKTVNVTAKEAEGIIKQSLKVAYKETDKATHQAMEGLVHNLNTMHSRAGAQVPFSSINYGTDTSLEGRMVIKNLLLATDEGLGNGETAIFPIQVFKVKEGVNYNPEDPNYDLFKLSCKVSAKRLFPNYVFLDAPHNIQYYVPGRPETEVTAMGCRTRVMGNVYDPNNEIAYSRGNLSFTSLNLPRIAITANGNEEKFYADLEKTMDLIIRQLYDRYKIQATKKVYNFPFLMGQGVWLGSDKLGLNDTIGEVIKHGSLSMGFIGLAETLTALYGKHHGESDEMQAKGLEIIKYMRAFCDKKAQEYKMNFTLLATPAEGLSGYFVRKDKKIFGEIPGVTDKDYYTNSFHVPVSFNISAYDKIQKEAPYHALANAGHITYVELDGDTSKNVEAFESVIRCMKEAGVGYGSINHPVDRDPVCGYVGVIGDTCPRCGRRSGEALSEEKLEEIRKQYGVK